MLAMNRGRTVAVGLAIAVHVALGLLVLQRRPDPAMAPDSAMQVTLVFPPHAAAPPSTPPKAAAPVPPILHRPVEAAPIRPEAPPAVSGPPAAVAPAPAPSGDAAVAVALSRTLRSHLGCAGPTLASLTDAERAACDEKLGRDVANVKAYPVISPKLKKVFDKTFECKPDDEACLYRIGKGPYPGLIGMFKKKKKTDWD